MVIDDPPTPKSPKFPGKTGSSSQDIPGKTPVKLCCLQTITIPFLLGTRIMAMVEYVVLEINI
jgi:hypothetical protein